MERSESAQSGTEREETLPRLSERQEFRAHLAAYAVINAAVWIIWATTGGGYPWPAWLTGLWAIGLVLDAGEVYLPRPTR